MLLCFENIEKNRFVCALRDFFRSGWYLAIVVSAMVCANLFSLEWSVFCLYFAFGALIVLFCEDLQAALPLILCCYPAISEQNNPALFVLGEAHVSIFYLPEFRVRLTALILSAVTMLLLRLFTILLRERPRGMPALFPGFCALGLSFVLGGLFSPYYGGRTAFFGAAEIAALGGSYLFVRYSVDWRRSKEEFAKLLTLFGAGIVAELIGIYCFHAEIFSDESAGRGVLVTGWGMYNNIGCLIALCLPAPLFLALRKKRGWIFTAVAFLFLYALLMTQSRGAILFGGIIFLTAYGLLLVKGKGGAWRANLIVMGVAVTLAAVLYGCFREKLDLLFSDLFEQTFGEEGGDITHGRMRIYEAGIEKFLSSPSFGVGFYEVDGVVYRWGRLPKDAFLPPRYHDTYVQLLASGGIFALICYLLHRVETIALFLRHPTDEKLFLALCVSSIVLTSIFDCHFFNFGPALFYGALCAMAEGEDLRAERPLLQKRISSLSA